MHNIIMPLASLLFHHRLLHGSTRGFDMSVSKNITASRNHMIWPQTSSHEYVKKGRIFVPTEREVTIHPTPENRIPVHVIASVITATAQVWGVSSASRHQFDHVAKWIVGRPWCVICLVIIVISKGMHTDPDSLHMNLAITTVSLWSFLSLHPSSQADRS